MKNNYHKVNRSGQAILESKLEKVREKFMECLNRLRCTYELPSDLTEITDYKAVSKINFITSVNIYSKRLCEHERITRKISGLRKGPIGRKSKRIDY